MVDITLSTLQNIVGWSKTAIDIAHVTLLPSLLRLITQQKSTRALNCFGVLLGRKASVLKRQNKVDQIYTWVTQVCSEVFTQPSLESLQEEASFCLSQLVEHHFDAMSVSSSLAPVVSALVSCMYLAILVTSKQEGETASLDLVLSAWVLLSKKLSNSQLSVDNCSKVLVCLGDVMTLDLEDDDYEKSSNFRFIFKTKTLHRVKNVCKHLAKIQPLAAQQALNVMVAQKQVVAVATAGEVCYCCLLSLSDIILRVVCFYFLSTF